jgi:hypothetical protein
LKKLFIIIHILILLINIYNLLKNRTLKKNLDVKFSSKNEKIAEKLMNFWKISDYFIINNFKRKYKEIAEYLNNKYTFNINKNINIKTKNLSLNNFIFPSKRKKVNLYSVDLFSITIHKKWLKDKLKDKFIIKFNKNKPDYLIYNVFGNEHLNPKYSKSIKIAIFTENIFPDFKEADYIIGHYHINYLDRYFKYSIFFWKNLNKTYYNLIRKEVLNNPIRTKFCAAVISNINVTDKFRINFINELNKYKKIDMGGKHDNNIGGQVKDKIKFLSLYKFSIAMENSKADGYNSEKILDSFLAGTIPIYYGDYMIDEYINPKSYILIKGEKDIQEKIEYIKKIDNDINLYRSILKENVLLEENIQNNNDKELKQFLFHIFEQDKSKAIRNFY